MTNTEKRQPMKLSNVFWCGLGFSVAVIGICFYFFAWQAAGRKAFWLAGLNQEAYFAITRNAVTLAGALVVGVTIFFSYRKQQTAETAQKLAQEAQATAAKAQRVAQKTLQLSLKKHDLEKVSDLRNRYARSAEQLASEKSAVQMAGLHSLAALADDWKALDNNDEQQVCISLLCSFVKEAASAGGRSEVADAAVTIVTSRLRKDLSAVDKRWSDRIITLEHANLGLELVDATVRDGHLILRDCTWHETGMIKGLHLQSGVMELQGEFVSPWFMGAQFEGGRLELHPAYRESEVDITFADCDFNGGSVFVSPFIGQAVSVDFIDCHFTDGNVVMSIVGASSSVRFSGCTFESPSVLSIASRKSTSPKMIFKNCTYIGAAKQMELDPESAMMDATRYARPFGEKIDWGVI